MIVKTSLPPQKAGANYLINQYLKYIHQLGKKTYVGAGYLLHYQRPYTTNFNAQGEVISTERFSQVGHGASIYLGANFSKITIESSFHFLPDQFNNFGGLKVGYRLW